MSRFITCEHPQGTDGWLQDRAGKATGSRAADILATIKSGEAAARADYRMDLVLERITGSPVQQGYVSPEMQWGIDKEPFARMAWEEFTGSFVSESGFVYLRDLMAGCSVDGFIDDSGSLGIWECKCPKSKTHYKYIKDNVLPSAYKPQILHNLYVTGAAFAEFTSFDPRMPAKLQLFTLRYERDDNEIQEYESKLLQFLAEVDEEFNQLQRLAA